MTETAERLRRAIIKAVKDSGLTCEQFAKRLNVHVTTLYAYRASNDICFREPKIETLVNIAAASGNPQGFMLSLLPPDAERAGWTQADKLEAMEATEAMARETLQLIQQAGSDEAAFNKLHARFAACYLMAYDARLQAMRKGRA